MSHKQGIPDLGITTGKLAALAVTEGKLAALAVTSGKIGANAVIAGKLANGAVDTAARVANAILTTTQLAAAAGITGAQLAAAAGITGAQLAAAAGITLAQLAAGITSKITWLAAPDAIGDWIAGNVTADTNVDLSDDGVPAGATAVVIGVLTIDGDFARLACCSAARASGDGDWIGYYTAGYAYITINALVECDASRHIHARWSDSRAITTNVAYVLGYII